ncbi:uncharacterized protein PGTG_05695 [Puccinia graminis f. sp. tritici CRL 75-36-700-3]|uniref:Uncharacterized protein n=1 Tax=Puccinia graminis f. sp. tritici (strain CRL 75-36-700-3 / race SCCL) TaxID=418459 RepID=E3K559_PUCGT|nr:uncharacterized protein PGTG_05695 [Puccinia graminis f. sp. tritici CRL 75-36-700-3]EFP79374.1 hypothetical protein PGTG_05695 [Puccinia graminis f. sp. tritici CRL 75-36-700-3]
MASQAKAKLVSGILSTSQIVNLSDLVKCVITALPEELFLSREPVNLKSDNADVFKGLDLTFLGSRQPKRISEEFDFSYNPENDPFDLFPTIGLSVSEEKGGRHAAQDQEAESYHRRDAVSNERLQVNQQIQPPISQVHAIVLPTEPHAETSEAVLEGQPDDIKPIGSNRRLKVDDQIQRSINQVREPIRTEVDSEGSEIASGAEWYGRKRVGSNNTKRLKGDQGIRQAIDQFPTLVSTETHAESPVSKAEQMRKPERNHTRKVSSQTGKRMKDTEKDHKYTARDSKYTTDYDARYFKGKDDSMLVLVRRAKEALDHQTISEATEFELFRGRVNEQFKEIAGWYKSTSPDRIFKIGGLETIIRKLSIASEDGERCCYHVNICLPLRSMSNHGLPIKLKINALLTALDLLHNLVRLNGLDRKILRTTEPNHKRLFEWVYDLIFADTPDHLPLLGKSQVKLPIKTGDKAFNEAQRFLHVYLTKPKRIGEFAASIAALDLLELWYKSQLSELEKSTFSSQEYKKFLFRAVQRYVRS